MRKFSLLLFILPMFLFSCVGNTEKTDNKLPNEGMAFRRNVIMLIGDGMGINQVYAAMTAAGGHLSMERCTASAYVKTYSANRYITDSAAGGTALACGKKTNNGMLGMTPDSTAVESLLEHYRNMGYATGFVVTSPVTHATPASFYAHIADRGLGEDIACQLYNSDIDFFCGGGRLHFEQRSDSLSYSDSLRAKGCYVFYSLDSVQAPALLPCGILAADIDLPDASIRGDYLSRATDLAIKSLQAKAGSRGFFLMVEGSQIDYCCHGNDSIGLIAEMLDFDRAVKCALDFAEVNGNTLVVITADHETGAAYIVDGSLSDSTVTVGFGKNGVAGTSVGHTGTFVPLFAFGPGSEQFAGIIENTDVPKLIMRTEFYNFENQ